MQTKRVLDGFSIDRCVNYLRNTVFFWDRIYWDRMGWRIKNSNKKRQNPKTLRVGWCSVFPPVPNGVAVMTESIVKEILKRQYKHNDDQWDVELYAIPIINKIEKRKFPGIKFAKISDPLDVIFFFCCHDQIKFANKKTKVVVWQTLHYLFKEKDTERELFEEIKNTDCIIGMTKMARDEYAKYKELDNRKERTSREKTGTKITYVPGAIQLERHKWLAEKKKKVIFVSRSMYYKGLAPFLDTIPLIVKEHPDVEIFAHMTLDTNALYFDELMNTAKKRKKEFPENFSYSTAWLSDEEIRNMYDESSVLVFPSNNEGFGIPLIEAMASGTLCIVGDRPPMNEIINDKVTGFCLPFKKQKKYHDLPFPAPEEIAGMCNKILSNPKKYQKIKKDARKKAEEEYNIKKVVDKLLQCAFEVTSDATHTQKYSLDHSQGLQ